MAPLHGYKGNYFEGGIRVPFFVNWPGKFKAVKSAEPIIGVDLYPTFLELAGGDQPGQPLDGVSLVSLFRGRKGRLSDVRSTGISRRISRVTTFTSNATHYSARDRAALFAWATGNFTSTSRTAR